MKTNTILLFSLFLCLSFIDLEKEMPGPLQPLDYTPITCGETVTGTNAGMPNNQTNHLCSTFFRSFVGGEALYLLELTENKSLSIELKNTSDNNLSLFVYSVSIDPGTQELQLGSCLDFSTQGRDQTDIILLNLDAGNYWIVVDSGIFGSGPFELTVDCFDPPGICDFTNGWLIANGHTVYSETESFPNFYLQKAACIEETFPGNDSLYAKAFNYFHDGAYDYFSLRFSAADPGCRAFVFSCDVSSFGDCLEVIEQGEVFFPDAAPGSYLIVVANADTLNRDFQLTVLPEGGCPLEDQVEVQFDTEDTVTGFGNDFEAGNHPACYTGTRSYTGEDKVLVIEISQPDFGTQGRKYLQYISFESTSPMGLFVYDYACGGRCLGYLETEGPDEPSRAFTFPGFGIYYLVIDQAEPNTSGDFELSLNYTPNRTRLGSSCFKDPPPHTHELSFSESAATFLKATDSVYMDFRRSGAVTFYNRTKIPWSGNTLADVEALPNQGGRALKCGYDVGEEFVFFALREDGTYVELEAEFAPVNRPLVTATNTYQPNGHSHVLRFSPQAVRLASNLVINPETIKDLNFQSVNLQAFILSNSTWQISQAPEDDWFTISPTQGEKNAVLTITVLQNPSLSGRTGTFEVLGPTLLRALTLQQDASSCHLQPITVTLDSLNNQVLATTEGFFAVSVTGGYPPYFYEWHKADGTLIGKEEDIDSLGAGSYALYVEDTQGCREELSGLTITQLTSSAATARLNQQLRIFPNPTPGRFTLESTALIYEPVTIEAFNALGQRLWQRVLPALLQPEALDISGLPQGVYWVKIRVGKAEAGRRVMVY